MDKKKQVAEKIKDRLKELGINRQEFAGMMNVQPSAVTRWLRGDHNFTVFTLFEIERILGMPLFDYEVKKVGDQFMDEFI